MPGGPSYDYGFYSRLSKFVKRVIAIVGASRTINSQTVIVVREDGDGYVTECKGTVTITDAGAGYAKGCLYTKTDGSAGTILYLNEGTSSSCDFNAVGMPSTGDITAVTADTGLSGGGSTGAVSLAANTALLTKTVTSVVSFLPAPTAADQDDLERYILTVPSALTVVAARIVCSTATSGSDATNNYQFDLYNTTTNLSLATARTSTNGSELGADTPKALTIDQNQTVADNDVLVLRTSIKDDGGAGPTDLSAAILRVEIEYTTV